MSGIGLAGSLAGGIAAGRDARLAAKKQDESNSLMKQLIMQKAAPAQGVGGEPVTPTGTPLKVSPADVNPAASKTLSGMNKSPIKKVGSAIAHVLGFAKGGRITKSGVAFVHKGETILPAKKSGERKALRVTVRKSGRR